MAKYINFLVYFFALIAIIIVEFPGLAVKLDYYCVHSFQECHVSIFNDLMLVFLAFKDIGLYINSDALLVWVQPTEEASWDRWGWMGMCFNHSSHCN